MGAQTADQTSGRSSSNKPQRRFQFIDNTNLASGDATSTQVRRHVMQEYMREKRWQSRNQTEVYPESLDLQIQSTPQPRESRKRPAQTSQSRVPSQRTIKASQPAHPHAQNEQSSLTRRGGARSTNASNNRQAVPKHQPYHQIEAPCGVIESKPGGYLVGSKLKTARSYQGFYLTPQSFAQISDLSPTPPLTPPLSIKSEPRWSSTSSSSEHSRAGSSATNAEPSSILSAARTDPFDSLPITLSRQDQELFDFYATIMPSCSYGFERRNPQAHNWYLSVFIPEAMKSPVAFQNTVLVHAANTQAWVKGLTETPLAIEHRARALEMLSDLFRERPHDTSDAAISSTLSAAALEDFDPRVERREYAWLHWRVAVQKIRDRGGPTALEQSGSLRMLINWSDYIFSGYNGLGSTFFFDHSSSGTVSSVADDEMMGREEVRQQCEEFIVFVKCTEQLALVAAQLQHKTMARQHQQMRYSVFQPGQPLYELLASPNGPRYTKTGQLKQIISRLAALMTINVAVYEYRHSTASSEEFFRELVQNIKINDLDRHLSVEALLQILLSGSQAPNLRHTERPWLVGRLLKIAKRLSRTSWERLNDFLLQCLTLGPSFAPVMHQWEHELRTEIISAPLVSYVLPLTRAP